MAGLSEFERAARHLGGIFDGMAVLGDPVVKPLALLERQSVATATLIPARFRTRLVLFF
jgi:hypothetical protein